MKKATLITPRTVALYILALVMTVATPLATLYAAEDQNCEQTVDYQYYRTNRILWKDECKTVTGCVANGGAAGGDITGGIEATDLSDLKKSPTLEKIFQDLINGGMTTVQAAAVMGNLYHESGRTFDPDTYEGGVDTPASGYGIVQWTNNRPDYTTGRRVNLEKYAQQLGVPKSDLDFQIKYLFLEYNGEADGVQNFKETMADGAFGKSTSVADATEQWMKIYENPHQEGNDPAALNSVRIPAAKKIYGFYKDLTPAEGAGDAATGGVIDDDAATTTCDGANEPGTDDSAGAGDIVATALSYAWPDPVDEGVKEKNQATKAYQTAKPKYAPEGNWSDCGAFVATVMIASGVDPDIPTLGVTKQAEYFRANPDKYTIIENATLDDIQPGDLLVENNNDHIEIAKGGAEGIDASNNFRVPSVRPTGAQYMVSQGSFIARFIGANE